MNKINRTDICKIYQFLCTAIIDDKQPEDLNIELNDKEYACIYLSDGGEDIYVDIYDIKTDEETDGGGGCSLEDFEELEFVREENITQEQLAILHEMIYAKAILIDELCYMR